MTILRLSGQVSRQCVNISIAMDGIVEPAESFNVVLETSDPAVVVGTSTSQVVISDSDSKCVFSCRTYCRIATNNIFMTCSLRVHSGAS